MKLKIYLLLILNCLIISAVAQNKTKKYLEDKYSWYVSLNLGNDDGRYQKIVKDANMTGLKV